ncbi:DNA-directed DNA polymerase [Spizellomyces sp. 'palustris']|nr:DNA-directed DNA polymerase [Spizellomyces sp. 'palustris']
MLRSDMRELYSRSLSITGCAMSVSAGQHPLCLSGLRVHIIETKMRENRLQRLRELLGGKGAQVVKRANEAELVVTGLTSPARIAKHLDMREFNIPVVSADWLCRYICNDDVKEIVLASHATIDLAQYAVHGQGDPTYIPPSIEVSLGEKRPLEAIYVSSESENERAASSKRPRTMGPPSETPEPDSTSKTWTSSDVSDGRMTDGTDGEQSYDHDTDTEDEGAEYDRDIPLDPRYKNVSFECCRPHPLVHHNMELVTQLQLIERKRELSGEARNALSYRHAISALISYPRAVKTWKEARKIKGVGEKIAHMIREFLKTGSIQEANTIKEDTRFHVMNLFASVYGVGPSKAREWYNKGYRSIADVQESEEHLPRITQVGLEMFDDFSKKMARADVEEILGILRTTLDDVEPGCIIEPVGGYRRGKPLSGDCDVVITHPVESRTGDLVGKLVDNLKLKGYIKHIMWFGEGSDKEEISELKLLPGRKYSFDRLAKAFVAFLQPSTNTYRQVDLIIAPFSIFPCAVLGWSGSKQFERGLRDWCKRGIKGYHFASHGLFDRRTNKRVDVKSEKEIFEILKLPYIQPTLRNA